MKRNILFRSLFAAALLSVTSCSDFLTEDPQGRLTPDTFFSSQNELNMSVYALYSKGGLYDDDFISNWAYINIRDELLKIKNKESIKELKEILEVADLVKFAKFRPSLNENDRNMLCAIDFVNATKDVEEENQKPVEKKVVNERSMTQKRWLIASIIAVSAIMIAVAALLITDLGHLIG